MPPRPIRTKRPRLARLAASNVSFFQRRFRCLALPILGALGLFAGPLLAEGPASRTDTALNDAQTALARGMSGAALERGLAALKAQPLGADENLQMSLTLFWLAQFSDSARHMRRALAQDLSVLARSVNLRERIPPADVNRLLLEMATPAATNAELCFLTGALLLLDRDMSRARLALLRAEELSGTDGQVTDLLSAIDVALAVDRSMGRATRYMQSAAFDEAARLFICSAMDRPRHGLAYAGLALSLAAEGDDLMALRFAHTSEELTSPATLLQWLADARPAGAPLALAARRFEAPGEGAKSKTARLRLACMLWFAAGYYESARNAALALLVESRLDSLARPLLDFMQSRSLEDDPVEVRPQSPKPDEKELPKPAVEKPAPSLANTIDDARKAIRKLDYSGALKLLEPLVSEDQKDLAVFHLLYVVLVGRGELIDAATAYQAWFLRAPEAERMRLGVLRPLFDRDSDYEAWKRPLLEARNTDLIAAVPRLLLAACDISEGRYTQARTNLAVALRAEPRNATLQELSKLLGQAKYDVDTEVPRTPDAANPRVVLGEAERLFRDRQYEAARSRYLAAAELDPSLKDIPLCLLKVNFALADYERACTALEQLLAAQQVETLGADAYGLPLAGSFADSAEFTRHFEALRKACEQRPLSDKPWLLLGAIQYGRRSFADARDALQRYSENTLAPARPNGAAMKLLESAKKLAN